MNIAIVNQNVKIINSLTVDIIKTLNGEFTKEEMNSELVNFVFEKAIIDITAIKNYYDSTSVINFLSYFDSSKVLLLLNDSDFVNSNGYLKVLVENGYYNFTRNAAGINYLLNHPNTYDDVKKYLVETTITKSPSDVTEGNSKVSINDFKKHVKIIGIENLTPHAGATTLMYMMVKQLKQNYQVKGIEVFKQDAIYFHYSDLSFCTSVDDFELEMKKNNGIDALIVDLNGLDIGNLLDEKLYLVEPGIVRLNKLLKSNQNVYDKVKGHKVVLNRSSIKDEDLNNFAYETKFKIFYNMPNINDRADRIQYIDKLLVLLGFEKQRIGKSGLFGIFK